MGKGEEGDSRDGTLYSCSRPHTMVHETERGRLAVEWDPTR